MRRYARVASAESRMWQMLNRCIDKELKRLGIVPPPYDYSGKCSATGLCEIMSQGGLRRRGEGCSKSEALFNYKVSCLVGTDSEVARLEWRSKYRVSYENILSDYLLRRERYQQKNPNHLNHTWR